MIMLMERIFYALHDNMLLFTAKWNVWSSNRTLFLLFMPFLENFVCNYYWNFPITHLVLTVYNLLIMFFDYICHLFFFFVLVLWSYLYYIIMKAVVPSQFFYV